MISKVLGFRPEKYSVVFKDVADKQFYSGYVLSAFRNGIIKGDGVAFRPDETITREQMGTIIMSAMKSADSKIKAPAALNLAFADTKTIEGYAIPSISQAKQLGLMQGFPDNKFYPKKNLTREEAAKVIVKLMQTTNML